MPVSSRFAVAVHILTLLDLYPDKPLTSEYIASSVNTNPAVVRRLVSRLTRARLVSTRLGSGGGAVLRRPAADITLDEVYRAVHEPPLFAVHRTAPNPDCMVGRHIASVLRRTMGAAETAVESALAAVSLADVGRGVVRREKKGASGP